VVIADVPPGPLEAYVGLTLTEIARTRQEEPVDAALALLEAGGGDVLTIVHGQSENNIRRIMTHPATMIASDGWTLSPRQEGRPHPRSYGTYARLLGSYVRDEGVLSLETAIQKVTSLPAARLGLTRRGTIREGHAADLVLFDDAQVIDRATFEDPHQFCEGVSMVVVNGQVVIDEDGHTESAGGRVLRHGAEQ
jgi:N-acyl-D-amino-acid deacylase